MHAPVAPATNNGGSITRAFAEFERDRICGQIAVVTNTNPH
jgi:hypothetical protein